MRFVKRVSDRGTVTLPAEIRSVLDLREGDIVEFEVHRIVQRVRQGNPNVEISKAEARAPDATTEAPQ